LYHKLNIGNSGNANATSAAASLQAAQEAYTKGDLQAARQELDALVPALKDDAITPQALVMLANIDIAAGMYDTARSHLQRAANEFPGSAHQPVAAIAYARLLERDGNHDEAAAIFEDVSRTASPEVRAPALAGLARRAERANELLEAQALYREATALAEFNSANWNEAIDGLGRVNVAIIFSPMETPESKVYSIASGDSITSIGNALNTTQALLIRANNLADPTKLNIGQRLKYTPKDFRIVIERSTCRLFLLDNNGVFKRYRTGLGRPGQETTLGKYKIGNKQQDPTWFKPGFGPIPPLHPENELGTRWMPLVPENEGLTTDLGIHGTIAPETIGQYASSGCPRLYKEEVEELYDLVVRATPVEIVDVIDPAQNLMLASG
jgi:tetratricopeptide (TPR) repeat protein